LAWKGDKKLSLPLKKAFLGSKKIFSDFSLSFLIEIDDSHPYG
jgi:hypothetical protein